MSFSYQLCNIFFLKSRGMGKCAVTAASGSGMSIYKMHSGTGEGTEHVLQIIEAIKLNIEYSLE